MIYWWWHDGGASHQGRLSETESSLSAGESNSADITDKSGTETSALETRLTQPTLAESAVTDDSDSLQRQDPSTEPELINGEAVTTAVDGNLAIDAATTDAAATPLAAAPTAAEAESGTANDTSAGESAATASNARILSLNFTDDCWIKITDSQGKVLSEGVKKAQQSLVLEGEPPFKVILGVPTAVRAEYLGKAVDLSSFVAGRSARLTVPQS